MKQKKSNKKKYIQATAILIMGIFIGTTLCAIDFKMTSHDTMHMHNILEVPKNKPIPEISIEVIPDKKIGYNLNINTQNFEFAPENVNTNNVFGEGHAHLYIDHVKITRVYSNWYYLDVSKLEKGEHEILVTLNSNEHEDLTLDGETIEAKQTITIE